MLLGSKTGQNLPHKNFFLFLEVSEQNKNSLIFNLKSRKIGHREHGRGELILKSLGTLSLSVKFLFSMPHVSQSVNVCTVTRATHASSLLPATASLFPPPAPLIFPQSIPSHLSSLPNPSSSLPPSLFPLPTASSLGAPKAPQFPTFHPKPKKGALGAQNLPHDQNLPHRSQ